MKWKLNNSQIKRYKHFSCLLKKLARFQNDYHFFLKFLFQVTTTSKFWMWKCSENCRLFDTLPILIASLSQCLKITQNSFCNLPKNTWIFAPKMAQFVFRSSNFIEFWARKLEYSYIARFARKIVKYIFEIQTPYFLPRNYTLFCNLTKKLERQKAQCENCHGK